MRPLANECRCVRESLLRNISLTLRQSAYALDSNLISLRQRLKVLPLGRDDGLNIKTRQTEIGPYGWVSAQVK